MKRLFSILGASLMLVISMAALGLTADADSAARATTAIEQAVKADPNNPELLLHLGFAYKKVNRTDDALKTFEKVNAMDPKNQDALFMLGMTYEQKNRKDDALKMWKAYVAAETDAKKRSIGEKHVHTLSQ